MQTFDSQSFEDWLPGAAGARKGSPAGTQDDSRARDSPVPELRCSAKGCGATAEFAMLWNNPRIHTPERRKVWLACPDHRTHLHEYLAMRELLRDDVPVSEIPEGAG